MHPRHLSDAELPIFVTRMHAEKQPMRLIIAVMLYAGTRLAETLQTCWADLTHLGEPKTALVIDADISKTRRERTIPIGPALHEEIRVAFQMFAQPKGIHLCNSIGSRVPDGKPVTGRTVERRVMQIGQSALGRKLTPHMLRHTFATRLLKVTNIRAVQDLLGHRRLSTTQIYTHPSTDELHQALVDLDGPVEPAKLDNDDTEAIQYG